MEYQLCTGYCYTLYADSLISSSQQPFEVGTINCHVASEGWGRELEARCF